MAKNIIIDTPRGTISTYQTKEGKLFAKLDWDSRFRPDKEKVFKNMQTFIDQECIRRMVPLTPRRTGVLIKSATLGTTIGSGEIHQIAPYARRQYYEHKKNSYWFERMKNRHKDSILKGAQKIG